MTAAARRLGALCLVMGCLPPAAEVTLRPGHAMAQGTLRPDDPASQDMFRFRSTDVVERFDSAGGGFRVHYTRSGPNAVPAADLNANSVPDHVESVAALYEQVAAFYADTLGFRRPRADLDTPGGNGGDARMDVYLIDFNLSADGAFRQEVCDRSNPSVCSGYLVQENDFAGYGYPSTEVANKVLCSHEYFHAVQAAYDTQMGSVMAEGSAVWATEKYSPELTDLEGFVHGYLSNPDRSLDKPLPGPVDPFSYGSGLFFQFLDEKYGGNVVRQVWEAAVNGGGGMADPTFLAAVDGALRAHHGSTFAEAMTAFAGWNLFTSTFANPALGYARGSGYPRVRVDDAVPPLSLPGLRVFYASVQYRALPPLGRSTMTARLAAPAPQDLDGVRLLLSVRRGRVLSAPVVVEGGAEAAVLDTSGADALITGVINVQTQGASLRPGLCAGTPEEVTACVTAIMSGGVDAGQGGADAGVTTPDGGEPPPAPDEPAPPSLCACALHSSVRLPLMAALALLALSSRHRRRNP